MEKKHAGVRILKDDTIKAVLDDDLETLLRRLSVYDQVVVGGSICYFCEAVVTLENISMVFPEDRQVCFCCDKPECEKKMMAGGRGK